MAQTSSPALDAMSLQKRVEGKRLQPSRGSSRAACGQNSFTQLHALVWQTLGERSNWTPWRRSHTAAPHPLAWLWPVANSALQRQEPSSPTASLGPWTAQFRLSSAPTDLPQPSPQLLSQLYSLNYGSHFSMSPSNVHRSQSLAGKPQSSSPLLGAALHTMCSCACHATCEWAHCFNRNSNNVLLLSFWGLGGSDESLEVPGDNRTVL